MCIWNAFKCTSSKCYPDNRSKHARVLNQLFKRHYQIKRSFEDGPVQNLLGSSSNSLMPQVQLPKTSDIDNFTSIACHTFVDLKKQIYDAF